MVIINYTCYTCDKKYDCEKHERINFAKPCSKCKSKYKYIMNGCFNQPGGNLCPPCKEDVQTALEAADIVRALKKKKNDEKNKKEACQGFYLEKTV